MINQQEFLAQRAGKDWAGDLWVEGVLLDPDGYDRGGRYFGVGGAPLFRVYDAEGEVDLYFRASSPEAAMAEVDLCWPKATVAFDE